MPGLNQLKQFTDDIRALGDEEKIRAQRGEKIPPVSLPTGISEADDSDDFIIGMPSVKNGEDSEGADSAAAPDEIDELEAGMDDEIAALLNPQGSAADDDALNEFLNDPLPGADDIPAPDAAEKEEETPLEDLDIDSLLQSSPDAESPADTASDSNSDDGSSLDDLSSSASLDDLAGFDSEHSPDALADAPATDDFSSPEMENNPFDIGLSDTDLKDTPDVDSDNGLSNLDGFGDGGEAGPLQEGSDSGEPPISAAEDLSLGEQENSGEPFAADSASASLSNDDIFSMDLDALENESPNGEISLGDDESTLASIDDMPSPEGDTGDSFDFNTDSLDDAFGSAPSEDAASGENLSFESIPDASEEIPDEGNEIPMDTFDTSGMDGVDFGPEKPAGDDFPATDEGLGGDDDFVLDSSFEIPGITDTEFADLGKKKPVIDTVDFSGASEERPRNSLTDEEYAKFKKNLANYPLNLRIALEDFIARDEFTDEAVFEIIEKVLKKTSARQLATQLEKILDISINIPRDFERRSFAEYEAYKQSFQYQLKNRIIPAAIVGIIMCFVCFGLFKAGQHFIYEPVMASMHYKQGYTLLEANEFPQSEDEFNQAVKYRPVKKWFFKYALGYRNKKQFERAAQMYKKTLAYFNHDKQAGLDYAHMELYDRANYERAEEIVRREILDYHINDADGMLMLGDVFLEWAEVDPSKYELAKGEYLDLIQRYGSNNIYLSRMLRYFIRTDKLRDVLTYKNMLYVSNNEKQNLKNLGASDWTELSGYLLEKLYGTLSKNDEYLRSSIEDVLVMLSLAIKADPSNPESRYNLARYFIHNGNIEQAKVELEHSLELFDKVLVRTKKNVYREINATRVLGELYSSNREYLKAQTVYTRGINLYNEEHEASELEGDENTGRLFADMGDLDYFISGDMDDALYNYEKAIEIKNDTPSINYRIGSIYYNRKNYDNALVSFIKVVEKEPRNPNVLLSLGNVLALRGDNFAAESYYSDLIRVLNQGYEKQKILMPQEDEDDFAIVDLYLKANNNLGVALYRLAHQTGNSSMNAEATVRLSDSIRAWDSLTRNPNTMVRMEGSNLAAQNLKYITHAFPDFEPAIYTDIPRLLAGEKGLE